MDEIQYRYFLQHMAEATKIKYGLDKPVVGIRCAQAFCFYFGPDWTPEMVAACPERELMMIPNFSRKCMDYTHEWLKARAAAS